MRERIQLPDFSPSMEPPWNGPQSLSSAFEAISAAGDEVASQVAYHRLLYAIGNDHAGTYYPVALEILPALEVILEDGNTWAKHIVIEALIDLFCSFTPEPGHEIHGGMQLERCVRSKIAGLGPRLDGLASGDDVASRSARELLASIREPGAEVTG